MKKLLLVALLMLAAMAEEVDISYGKVFEATINEGGEYTFYINRSLHELTVTASPDAKIHAWELRNVDDEPEGIDVYKYISIGYYGNSVWDPSVVFAVAKNWLDKRDADFNDVIILKQDKGTWARVKIGHIGGDIIKYLFGVKPEGFYTFAIGVEKEECLAPTAWSQCLDGKQFRTVHVDVDGNCMPQNDVKECPVEPVQLGIRTDNYTTVAALAMLVTAALLATSVIKMKGKAF